MILDFEKKIAEVEEKIQLMKEKGEQEGEGSWDSKFISALETNLKTEIEKVYSNLNPWMITQIARHLHRPTFLDYVGLIFTDFIELHGDRGFVDDKAMVTGMAKLEDEKVFLIGQQKGKTLEEAKNRNFGMSRPEGYRKALRIMKLAEKFGRPVLTFIDTPGAYPGIDAEERGQGEAIARNLKEMAKLQTPIIATVIGEGGSGGALGIGIANFIYMLRYSIYSVISPEGCASILWRDSSMAPEAAKALKLTAADLLRFGVIDSIIDEPNGGAHRYPSITARKIKKHLIEGVKEIKKMSKSKLSDRRIDKFIKMGVYSEKAGK